jgi:hypothetical protein
MHSSHLATRVPPPPDEHIGRLADALRRSWHWLREHAVAGYSLGLGEQGIRWLGEVGALAEDGGLEGGDGRAAGVVAEVDRLDLVPDGGGVGIAILRGAGGNGVGLGCPEHALTGHDRVGLRTRTTVNNY